MSPGSKSVSPSPSMKAELGTVGKISGKSLNKEEFEVQTQRRIPQATYPKKPLGSIDITQNPLAIHGKRLRNFRRPDTLFGIAAALSGPALTNNALPDLLKIIARIPIVILWNWANLLIFDLANQRHPEAVEEDAINKPWRPIPTGRISTSQTRRLLLVSLPVVLSLNYFLGAWQETVILFTLTWMYNDLGGGDDGWIVRNIIIAFAFSQYNKGAMRVAAQQEFTISGKAWVWLLITSGVIGTTMHYQDMKDQDGDRVRGRRTAPLVLGDTVTRWTLAVPTAIWSVVCPAYWDCGLWGYSLPVGVGGIIVLRILFMKGFKADKRTWWIWTAWTGIIWLLPLFKDHSIIERFWAQYY